MGVQALNSLGIKFTAAAPQSDDMTIIARVQQLLGLDPRSTLLQGGAMAASDVLIRLSYRFAAGSAALEVSADRGSTAYLIGLDCYSWDTLALDRQYLEFMQAAYHHYREDVLAYLAPLTLGPRP